MQRRLFAIALSSLITIPCYAGFNGMTHHSRANCLSFNESISWDATTDWWFDVTSTHINEKDKLRHQAFWSPSLTWRGAALHLYEGHGGWEVFGIHKYAPQHGKCTNCAPYTYEWIQRSTQAIDCSIYDGWWDTDHPERKTLYQYKKGDEMKKQIMTAITTVATMAPLLSVADEMRYGIDIVPAKTFSLPAELSANKTPSANPNKRLTSYLLNLTDKETYTFANTNDPYDTHLKKTPTAIQLNFKYKPAPNISSKNIIGFAAIGSYNNGWTGIVEYFKTNVGTCGYYLDHIDYVNINQAVITNHVNNKPTIISNNNGNDADGYLTTIEWYTQEKANIQNGVRTQELKCASNVRVDDVENKMIQLAQQIDKQA